MRPKALFCTRGERGIRTPDGVTPILPFQGSAFDRSAISPYKFVALLYHETVLETYFFGKADNSPQREQSG